MSPPDPTQECPQDGLVDLHTHLLPGVDDGVRTLAEALEQLREARAQGICALACTPHTRAWEADDLGALLAERRRVYERLAAAAGAEGGLPRIGLGAEVLVMGRGASLEPPGMRINGTPFALVEVLFGLTDFSDVRETFLELLDRGHRPILAHVERYPHLQGLDLVDRWREDGILLQVNASSLVGEHGSAIRRRALELLDSGRADLVASDVHGRHMRLNHLGEAYVLVHDRLGEPRARRLFSDVPRTVFEGGEVVRDMLQRGELRRDMPRGGQVRRDILEAGEVGREERGARARTGGHEEP